MTSASAWRETGVDESYPGKVFTLWRCSQCGKQGVTTTGGEPSECKHGPVERKRR